MSLTRSPHVTRLDPGRPDHEEHIPYYRQYIDLVPEGGVIPILERQVEETVAFLSSFTQEQAEWRPAPGEWSGLDIVGHLADAERAFSYRSLKIARDDKTLWDTFEPDEWAAAAHYTERPFPDVLAEFVAVRRAYVAFLRGLDDEAWAVRKSDQWSSRSVRAIAYVVAGHELHHMIDLRHWGA